MKKITIDVDPSDYADELKGAIEVFPDGEPYWEGYVIKVPLHLTYQEDAE